jgi:hypothetical protein
VFTASLSNKYNKYNRNETSKENENQRIKAFIFTTLPPTKILGNKAPKNA